MLQSSWMTCCRCGVKTYMPDDCPKPVLCKSCFTELGPRAEEYRKNAKDCKESYGPPDLRI